jgi:hypothetical protein
LALQAQHPGNETGLTPVMWAEAIDFREMNWLYGINMDSSSIATDFWLKAPVETWLSSLRAPLPYFSAFVV